MEAKRFRGQQKREKVEQYLESQMKEELTKQSVSGRDVHLMLYHLGAFPAGCPVHACQALSVYSTNSVYANCVFWGWAASQ